MQEKNNSYKEATTSNNKAGASPHEWIFKWSKDFTNKIEKPIGMRESLLNRAQPQKCFQHSIIFSIYCTICRKVLCASCMYSTMTHRKHRVIPLQNAYDELKEDIVGFEEKIPRISAQGQGILNVNNELLLTLERNYNQTITQITNFYSQIKDFLVQQQKKQINQVKIVRDDIRAQILVYNQQLTRLTNYVKDKYRQYTDETVKSKILIVSRNVCEILLESSNYFKQNLLSAEQFGFPTNRERIKQIRDDIELKVKNLLKTYHPKDFKINKMKTQGKSEKTSVQKYGSNRSISSKKNEIRDTRRYNSSVMGLGRSLKHA